MRRLGLQLVGRTMEASKLLPAKQAFRILDPDGKGHITEDDLVEVWGNNSCHRFFYVLVCMFFCAMLQSEIGDRVFSVESKTCLVLFLALLYATCSFTLLQYRGRPVCVCFGGGVLCCVTRRERGRACRFEAGFSFLSFVFFLHVRLCFLL